MLLIDAIYINDSGGKILLDYLLQELEKTDKKCIYLLDSRVEDKVFFLKNSTNEVHFLEASLYKRHMFYLKNRNRFSSVLCFGSLPPSIKLKAKVYTYMHSDLYIKVPKDSSRKFKFLFFLKRKVLQFLEKNTDFWMLQTETVAKNFKNKFNISENKILQMPFYPIMRKNDNVIREKNTFLFVSNAVPHKNHIRLINAFCKFYDREKKGKLIITVDFSYQHLIELIDEKQKKGYPILNVGFIERENLADIYSSAEFLIYPSLAESFGLGLAEAIDGGCKVIAADLPYTYQVCNPSLTFNPYSIDSIESAIIKSVTQELPESNKIITNDINQLILLLSE